MLEDIYRLLGYRDIFDIVNDDVRNFTISKAHEDLIELLGLCECLDIVSNVNEASLNKVENEYL